MTNIPDEIISVVGPIVESVASDISRRYRNYGAEQADLSQQGWLWIYAHPRKMLEWFDSDNYSEKDSAYILARVLRNECSRYGEAIKAQHLGYSLDDLSYYSRTMVRELLPMMFDDEAWHHPEQGDGERRSGGDPATGGNWVATLADVSRAYDKLDPSDRDLLARFHRDGVSNNAMAESCGVSKQTMSDWHDKAVRRLVDQLGGVKARAEHGEDCDHEWNTWMGRRAQSNAAARAQQQGYYDE